MSLSLTRDEFFERLAERHKLLQVAVAYDLKSSKEPVRVRHEADGDIHLEMSKVLAPIVRSILVRAVELVYQDE